MASCSTALSPTSPTSPLTIPPKGILKNPTVLQQWLSIIQSIFSSYMSRKPDPKKMIIHYFAQRNAEDAELIKRVIPHDIQEEEIKELREMIEYSAPEKPQHSRLTQLRTGHETKKAVRKTAFRPNSVLSKSPPIKVIFEPLLDQLEIFLPIKLGILLNLFERLLNDQRILSKRKIKLIEKAKQSSSPLTTEYFTRMMEKTIGLPKLEAHHRHNSPPFLRAQGLFSNAQNHTNLRT